MKRILLYSSIVILLIGFYAMRQTPAETVATIGREDLRVKVEAYILENEMPAKEPRLDPVWQFVPGIEGIKFDFELSYQNMLSLGNFDPDLMIGQTIPINGCSSGFRQHRMYRGHESSPYVGLLINVAWGGPELRQMLDILDENGISASIFFEGRYAAENPDLVMDAFKRGHIIGNHSYSHPSNWLNLSYNSFEDEIIMTNNVLRNIIGEDIVFFAPPGGAFTDDTIKAAHNNNMYTILWSADSIDWRGDSASRITERVLNRISAGGLILTHPKPETVKALPAIIEQIRSRGYEFRRIDEIISGTRSDHFSD